MESPDKHSLKIQEVGPAQELRPSLAVSLCFWATLMLAVILYGIVALAPKIAVWAKARRSYDNNRLQLSDLESEVDYLERVNEALQNDPEFVNRIAGLQTGQSQTTGNSIPVSGSLMFGRDQTHFSSAVGRSAPFWERWAFVAARHRLLRRTLLIACIALTLFAFTFLNDAGANIVFATGRFVRAAANIPWRRYLAEQSPKPSHAHKEMSNAQDCSGQSQCQEDSRSQ